MARNVLTNINLNQNELQNPVLQPLATDPAVASSKLGQLYYNTTSHRVRRFNGTAWGDVGGGVQTVTTATGETVIFVDNTDAENPILSFKIAPTQGEGVTVTNGNTPAGGSAENGIFVSVQDGTTAQKGIVQLDSTPNATEETKAATPKGANVTITVPASPTEGYLKTYEFYQGGVKFGAIDIPKEFFLKTGKVSIAANYAVATAYKLGDLLIEGGKYYVVTADITAADNTQFSDVQTQEISVTLTAGETYIVLGLNIKNDDISTQYIVFSAKGLVDVYTAGDGIDITNNVIKIDNAITAVTDSKVYPITVDKNGLITAVGTAVKTVKTATGSIAVGSTSAAVTVPTAGTVIGYYATDASGNEVVTDVAVASGSVTFTLAAAYTEAISCYAIYIDDTLQA